MKIVRVGGSQLQVCTCSTDSRKKGSHGGGICDILQLTTSSLSSSFVVQYAEESLLPIT